MYLLLKVKNAPLICDLKNATFLYFFRRNLEKAIQTRLEDDWEFEAVTLSYVQPFAFIVRQGLPKLKNCPGWT